MDNVDREIFADGIGQIHFTPAAGGMVRFDFVSMQPSGENEPPKPAKVCRIVMPPQGFLAAKDSIQQMFDKLMAAGFIPKNPNAAQNTNALGDK
ncbi:MAG: hypothetical protein PHQ75_12780 [Thermoguttaceae bacterium]|nr:hypothetical protein [Thermoguttaceae bacterium]